jgi:hypothetical protein
VYARAYRQTGHLWAVTMLERPPRGKPPPPSEAGRRLEQHRTRARRHRERLKAGRMVVPVEVDGQLMDWMVRVRWLSEAEASEGDARKIGEAIARGLAASAKS